MRATQTWTALVAAAALMAGVVSFLVATPSQEGRIARDEVGFSRLDADHVFAAMGRAAEHHRAVHAATVGARAVTTMSRRWLAALPDSRARNTMVPANVRPATATGADAAPRRVGAFMAWADDLPANRWQVATSGPVQVAGADRTWTVEARVQVDVAQATTRTRSQVLAVEIQLRGSIAELGGAPRSWVVEDVIVGPSSGWLRAYRDPVVVGSGAVDVIAPSVARAAARDAAVMAAAELPQIATRYTARGGPATVAVWMVERPEGVRAVTRRDAPADVREAAGDATHAVAWSDDRGDVIIDLSRFQPVPAATRRASIRHALAHLVTRAATDRAPAILSEGIALVEERRTGRTTVFAPAELATLDAAFSAGASGIDEALAGPPTARLDGPVPELAAAATVAFLLEERGAARVQELLTSIDDGVAPATALRRTVGLAPRGVELQVAAWVRARFSAAE